MILTAARIQNFKGIENLELQFHSGFNLIKGVNGTGKTSILEALAVGLGGFVAGASSVNTRHFSLDEIRREYTRIGDGSCDERQFLPVSVFLQATLDDGIIDWTRSRTSAKASRSATNPRKIARRAEEMANNPEALLPVLCYHGTGRVWAQKRAKTQNVFKSKYSRTVGYTDALQDASNNKLLLDWCDKMERVSWQKRTAIAEYDAARQAVVNFLNSMEQTSSCEFFLDAQLGELMIRQDEKLLPVSCLSAGYQSLVWLVFDIASRMAMLNPFLRNQITETPGIVLIDELDMHLHPKWQWRVIDALRETFPQVQFIATSHAPILFSSAKDVWLIDIDHLHDCGIEGCGTGKEAEYAKSFYGLDVNNAIKQYQGNYDLPEEIKRLSTSIEEAMDAERYDEAKHLLDELAEKAADEFPLIVDLRTRYEIETGLMGLE